MVDRGGDEMIRQRLIRSYSAVAVIAMLILAACTPSALPTLTPASVTTLPTIVTLMPTMTATPTRAVTPTTTAIPSPTPPPRTPTITPTPVPTLTAKQEAEFVAAMLKTNGGCELPCWWGITPGETSHQAVRDFFSLQSIQLFSGGRHYEGSERIFRIPHPERLFDYDVYIRFDARDGVIRSIRVDSETFNLQRSERFTRDWRSYTWDQILTRYGPPSWVGIAFQPPMEPNAPTIYGLSLIYEPLGFEISYMGPAQYDPKASLMRACPDFNVVTAIGLRLVSPEDSVVELLLSESHAPSLGPSLEETTGMSVQTFYETFRNANSRACLEELSHLNNP